MENEPQEVESGRNISRLKREVRRLRNTASFRIGLHLTNTVRNPLLLIILPITFPLYCIYLGLERLGKFARPKHYEEGEMDDFEPKDCAVLFPTNGVGFGHFTRLFAIAKQMRKKNPDMEIIFFTPMPTLHIPYSENFPTYHLSGRYKHLDMDSQTWNMLVEEMLTLVFEVHKPKWFVFDGAYPYRGMLNAIENKLTTKKIWVRRGTFKKGSSVPVDSFDFFNQIIHPKESEENQDFDKPHSIETKMVSPISIIDEKTMLSRENVRNRFGIPLNSRVFYVQLGAGQINQIDSEIRTVVDAILEDDDAYVVLGESLLGERISLNLERLRIIRDYPNSIYFNGFDYSVQAGGYNSFHEMRIMQIPTLFLPNLETGMDDQLARCMVAESEGWGVVEKKRTKGAIKKALEKLNSVRKISIEFSNGATEVAELILGDDDER